MASTTLGWQWPVEQTAMPAAKSRKAFPSISSTMAPRPFLATSGYSRVNDGDMNFASSSITLLACGPGSSMSSRGNFVSAAVIIFLSSFLIAMDGQRVIAGGLPQGRFRCAQRFGVAPAKERGLNRRRTGSDVLRPEQNCRGFSWLWRLSFAFPADASVLRILNDYTTIRQFFADAVGGREVAFFLCGIAFSDELVNFRVSRPALRPAKSKCAELFAIMILHHGENFVESGQKFLRCSNISLAEVALIHRNVRLAHQVKHRRQRARSVQIFGKPRVKLLFCFDDACGHCLLLARREFSLLQAIREIPQPLHGTRRLLKATECEVELLAVRNTRQGKAQRRRFIAFPEQVAQRIEIAQRLGHFLALDEQMLRVQPIPREGLSAGGLALCDFVFVMRKREVNAT